MTAPSSPINLFEFEEVAKSRLPKAEYDFIAGGATDEITLRRTRAVYDSIALRPRMLVDVSTVDTSTTVLGQDIEFPVMLAPSGGHGRSHPDGELATVKAAGSMGTAMILSINASYTMEEVAKAATCPVWFQQYMFSDRGLTKSMAQRAKDDGYSALCITVDTKDVRPKRERNIRNKYITTYSPNLQGSARGESSWTVTPGSSVYDYGQADPWANWSYLGWLISNTTLPVVVKGIMTGEDARLCAEHGAKAVIVSNHGARHLDTTFATIEVLPEIVDAVGDSIEVYLDGGIRRGTDILKAVALGARAVLIGRPIFWGLAAAGEEGLRTVLQILLDELRLAMIQCGCPRLEDADVTLVGLKSPLELLLSSSRDLRSG